MSSPHELAKYAPGSILLDRYKSVRIVGVGGMGVVVHAVHLIEGTEVAIKFLLPRLASSDEAAARFVREARAATRIPSEHITRVLETGTSPELGPFIVMELLEGEDLAKHVRREPRIAVPVAIDLLVQAADAIAHAHAVGVIHRDVKPANLFLAKDAEGRSSVKVLDFGISKVLEEAPLEITKTSTRLGSGLYMSPEQMRSAKNVDHRTDVYGLGITLYEILTGTQPFVADSYADLCIKVSSEEPDPLRRHRADVPAELEAAIARAYARAPADRYESVPAFAAALAAWATPETRARIDALVALGRARPPLASGDYSSIAPPPPAAPAHPGSTTLRMAPGASGPPPGRSSAPPRSPSAPSLVPPGSPSATSLAPPRSSSAPSVPPPSPTAAGPRAASTARTVLLTAVGTFVVLSALVAAYALLGARRGAPSPADARGSAPQPTTSIPAPSSRVER